MKEKGKKERVWYCDALRVLAIALVVLVHVFADWRDLYLGESRTCYFILTCVETLTRVAVPIFFMLTGAFMLGRTREEKFSVFLKTRVLKLLIPFILISAVYYLYNAWQTNTGISLGDFLLAFSNNDIKYHFWFMYAIILIYLLIPFLNKMILNLSQRDLRNLVLVLAGGNLINTVSYITTSLGMEALTAWAYPNLLCYINYLFLGYYLYRYGIAKRWRKWLYLAGVLAIILMPILDILTVQSIRTDSLFVAGAIGPLIASAALFTFFRTTSWRWSERWQKFFRLTTPLVFSIYMIHVLVMNIVKAQLLKLWTPVHFVETCGFIAVEFVATLVASYLLALLLTQLRRIKLS